MLIIDKYDFIILRTKVREVVESGTPAEVKIFTAIERILDLAFPRLSEECEESYSE